nr:MAG TPA: hypothetical protein [Bacteriophage sp.]
MYLSAAQLPHGTLILSLICNYIVIFSFCLEYYIVFVTSQETKISC